MSSPGIALKIIIFIVVLQQTTTESTTSRSAIKEKKNVTESLFPNRSRPATNVTYDVLDVRTPPRFKFHEKIKITKNKGVGVGVAVPLDADSTVLNENSNKSTTTWVLLSGQTTTKPAVIDKTQKNQTLSNDKVKNNVINETTITTTTTTNNSTKKTEAIESKTDSINLENESGKKESKPKKKKNKNRRRKPSNKEATSISNINLKDSSMSNQLYSYLSREIVPTLGVGLVGLMVTAGLASYFLYHPLGPITRSDSDIDRKDTKYYQYRDKYSGGMPEEEAIGEVIAGMSNHLFNNKNPVKKQYAQPKYRQQNVKGTVETVPYSFEDNNSKKNQEFNVATEKISNEQIEDFNRMKIEHGPRNI